MTDLKAKQLQKSFSTSNIETFLTVYCDRIQMCINGTAVRTSCPSSQLFDYVLGTCKNDPVRCYPGSIRGVFPPQPTTPTTTVVPVTSFSSTTQDPNSRCTKGTPSFIAHESKPVLLFARSQIKKYYLILIL